MFPTIGFSTKQILRIGSSHMEIKRIFFLVENFTNLTRSCLWSYNFEKLIFMSKNWPNYEKVDCKAPYNLVELINFELDLKHKLDEFEGSFEWDEL